MDTIKSIIQQALEVEPAEFYILIVALLLFWFIGIAVTSRGDRR